MFSWFDQWYVFVTAVFEVETDTTEHKADDFKE